MEINQPKNFKPKIRGRKLRSGVNWKGAFGQEGVKQFLGVFAFMKVYISYVE
jgi:hypothetical protein